MDTSKQEAPNEEQPVERRATDPLDQLLHLTEAEAAGILPDEDRRAPEPVAEPEPEGEKPVVFGPDNATPVDVWRASHPPEEW